MHLNRALAAIAIGAVLPVLSAAQTQQGDAGVGTWRYGASVYAYLPSLSGTTSVPADANGTSLHVSAEKIVDSLKFTFMGSFDAHNGRWGVFTDLIYLNLGGDKQGSRDFTIGDVGLPANTTADLGWDLKGWVWTLAGEYRVVSAPELRVDLLAGTRLFDLEQTTRWNIAGNLGPIAPAGRSGSFEARETLWDGIVGVKGRYAFGSSRQWSVPFYLDVGTGQSDLTWQAAGGVSYAFTWGELTAMWRYLAYDLKSGKTIKDLNFDGPMFGATFRW